MEIMYRNEKEKMREMEYLMEYGEIGEEDEYEMNLESHVIRSYMRKKMREEKSRLQNMKKKETQN
jgi:hypothetical protein